MSTSLWNHFVNNLLIFHKARQSKAALNQIKIFRTYRYEVILVSMQVAIRSYGGLDNALVALLHHCWGGGWSAMHEGRCLRWRQARWVVQARSVGSWLQHWRWRRHSDSVLAVHLMSDDVVALKNGSFLQKPREDSYFGRNQWSIAQSIWSSMLHQLVSYPKIL